MRRFNPAGNERLTATNGLVLILLSAAEILTLLLGLHVLVYTRRAWRETFMRDVGARARVLVVAASLAAACAPGSP